MQLTVRSFILLLLTIVPLALGLLWLVGLWLMLVVALLLADWRMTPGAAAFSLARRHDDRLSLAAPNRIEVALQLRRSPRPLAVWLRDEPPLGFAVAESERILEGEVTPGEPHIFSYVVTPPRRGDFAFGHLHLRWQSLLGLLTRQALFPAAEAVKVYPNLVDVKKYDLQLRKNSLWELGLRNTKVLGSGTEFERLRDYRPDDEYRRINWKATARRGKPVSLEFESERSQNIMVLVDIGRMMRSPVGEVAKLDYAINAVLLLTYVAAQKGDKVGLLTFADEVNHWLSPRGGKGQFHRMLELLYGVESQPVEPDYSRAFAYFAARQSKRSLVLLFTDLTGSLNTDLLVAQMSRLRRRHLPLLVTLRDPTVQRLAQHAVEDSRTLYQRTVAEQLLDERTLTLERLRRLGVETLDVAADELSIAVINRYLELKARTMI